MSESVPLGILTTAEGATKQENGLSISYGANYVWIYELYTQGFASTSVHFDQIWRIQLSVNQAIFFLLYVASLCWFNVHKSSKKI